MYNGNFGRGGGIRTRDPLHPMQVRYQAALHPDEASSITRDTGSSRELAQSVLQEIANQLEFAQHVPQCIDGWRHGGCGDACDFRPFGRR